MEHRLVDPFVEHGDLFERGEADPVGGRVGELDRVEFDADRLAVGGRSTASSASVMSGSMSSTSKTRSKLTRAVATSRRALASAVSGA